MSVRSSAKVHLGIAVIRLAAVPPLLPLHSPGSDRSCRTLRSQIPSQLPFSPSPSSVLFLRPFAPRALPRFSATMASADSSPLSRERLPQVRCKNLSPRPVRLYPLPLRPLSDLAVARQLAARTKPHCLFLFLRS